MPIAGAPRTASAWIAAATSSLVVAGQVFDCERQLALVEQFQRVAGPADRADAVVAGVIDVVVHRG